MVGIFICKLTFKILNQAYKVVQPWTGAISALKHLAPISVFGANSFGDSVPIGEIWKKLEKTKKMRPI
jgi:hypothetical protein